MKTKCALSLLGSCLFLTPFGVQLATAAVVTNCDEVNLRAAIAAGGTVTFACDGIIQLTNTLTISQNTVLDGTGHTVTVSGGGAVRPFVVNNGVQFTLKAVTVANGFGTPHAGALLNNGSTRIIDCTLSNNVSLGSPSFGGAIFQGSGSLGITGCSFVGNRASGTNSFTSLGGAIGGGYFNQSGPVGITNSTFYGNSATSGGAIFITCGFGANGPVNILNSTFAANTNGGISYCNSFGLDRMVIENTILAYNNGPNCAGVTDGGHNISSDASGGFTHPFSLENTDPLFAPLANNGGSTLTLALLPGSPAIDAGSSSSFPQTDQRGVMRPVGAFCDAGALESTVAGTNAGVFQFAPATNLVTEATTNLVVTIVRAGGVAGEVSVALATANATATAGSDYEATNGTLFFAPGQRSNSFAVAIIGDTEVEGAETLGLNFSNPTGGAMLGRASASVAILDDDIGLKFSAANYLVGESAGTASITVIRAGATNGAVSVAFATSPGSATSGSDYQPTNGVLNFAAGQTSATFSVAILRNNLPESDETVNLVLSNPTGGAVLILPSSATLTIQDDDGTHIVSTCDDASLRQAVELGGTVLLDCDGVIPLSSTLNISADTVIDATEHTVILSGNGTNRLFAVGGGAQLTLKNITVANGGGNLFTRGGGIVNAGTLRAINCAFSNNVVNGSPAFGGAIDNSGTLQLSGCTFVNNRCVSGPGGAICNGASFVRGGPMFLTNCTFVGNVGHAVYQESLYDSFMINCTVASNATVGIANAGNQQLPGSLILKNTIIAGSTFPNCGGNVTDGGHNINSDASGNFTAASLINTDPRLGPLANNGGPTLTMALLSDSPAIDSGDNAACPLTDQRGFPRPYHPVCDIGSFEATIFGANMGGFRFTVAAYHVSEVGPGVTVTILRDESAAGAVTVDFTTSNGSALAGTDFVTTNGTLAFAAGEVFKSFTIQLLNDTVAETDETFTVVLSNPTGGAILGDASTVTVTIVDDDAVRVVNTCDETTLRAALAFDGRVLLNCDGTIVLTSSITISNQVTLDASGHDVTISGSNAVRLFLIAPGATFAPVGLRLADGYAAGTNGNTSQPGGPGEGGAVYNNGGVMLASGCIFLRNAARGGTGGPATFFGPSGTGGPGRGGVAYNGPGGHIIVSNCEFRLNQALGGSAGTAPSSSGSGGDAAGGILYNTGGTVWLTDCVVSSNTVVSGRGQRFGGLSASGVAYGAAVFNSGGDTFLSRVVASNNVSIAEYLNAAYGGVFHHAGGMFEMTDCHFTGNRALAGRGLRIATPSGLGGGHAFGGAASIVFGSVRMLRTTLDHNLAVGGAEPGGGNAAGSAQGGAIYNAGDVAITNSTFTGNEAQSGLARPFLGLHGRASGGAVGNDGGTMSLSHVTIAGNAASHTGGGAVGYFFGGGIFSTNGTIELRNTIVANSPSGSNCFGAIIDGGHNISSDGSANFTAPGSLNNTDPVLGPLADYGGPTPTMALLAGSPAIDAAENASCPETDQRGIVRPFGAACDIGAFESAPPYTILGRVTGYTTPSNCITLSAGSLSVPAGANGQYALRGLLTGNYTVTPMCSEAVFLLSNQVVSLGPDVVGLDFHSYRSNALTMERVSTGIVRSVFAGEAGQTHRVLFSPDLQQWHPYSTNMVQSSGIFDFFETNHASPAAGFFQVVKP